MKLTFILLQRPLLKRVKANSNNTNQTCLKHHLHGKQESIHFSQDYTYNLVMSSPFLSFFLFQRHRQSLIFTNKLNLPVGRPSFASLEWMGAWTAQYRHGGKDSQITRDWGRCRESIRLTEHPGRKQALSSTGRCDGWTRSPRNSPHHTWTPAAPLQALQDKAPPTVGPDPAGPASTGPSRAASGEWRPHPDTSLRKTRAPAKAGRGA